MTGIDNDTRRLDRVRLGPVAGLDSGTRGSYFFDAFESRRVSYIGALAGNRQLATPEVMALKTTIVATTTLQADSSSILQANISGLGIEARFPADASSPAAAGTLGVTETNSLPDGYALVGDIFTIQVSWASLMAAQVQPVTVAVNYGASNPDVSWASLVLQSWNRATEQWEALPTTADPNSPTITALISPPATVALFVKENTEKSEESVNHLLYLPVIHQ